MTPSATPEAGEKEAREAYAAWSAARVQSGNPERNPQLVRDAFLAAFALGLTTGSSGEAIAWMCEDDKGVRGIAFSKDRAARECRSGTQPIPLYVRGPGWGLPRSGQAAQSGNLVPPDRGPPARAEASPLQEIGITPEMIEAGNGALWRELGFKLDGDKGVGVTAIFRAMLLASRAGAAGVSGGS